MTHAASTTDEASPPRAHLHRRSLSRAPLFDRATLKDDVLSGVTVALVGLPQCLAYAMMSGLPPAYGLATAAVPGVIAALLGRSAQVITGPTNTTSLLILAALGPWIAESGLLSPEGLPVLATLTLLAGLIRVAGAFAGAAVLLRFLPASVLVGFTAGAGILIALMQLDEALGLPTVRGGTFIDEVRGVHRMLAAGHVPAAGAVVTTLATSAALLVGQRWVRARRWPVALLAVLAAMLAAWALDLDAAHGLPLVSDRSPIPQGWPPAALPSFDPALLGELALPAAAIVFLGTLELTVTARAGGERPDMKRELFAQGVANAVGAFTAAFPASASLTRSALLKLGGGVTRLAALSAALALVPILLFGGGFVGYIPQASLAGVLFVTAIGMIDRARIAAMWSTGKEARVLVVVTLIATLTLPLEWAILIGAGLGLALHLARTSSPRVIALVPEEDGALRPLAEGERVEALVLEVSGDLHYAAVAAWAREVRAKTPEGVERLVIDVSHAHEMRFAAMTTLEQLATELGARGVHIELAGVSEHFAQVLAQSGSGVPVTRWDPRPGAALARCLAGDAAPATIG